MRGGLHYSSVVPENDWGKRQQLHVKRHDRLLEVFSDIAFGVGSQHRSLQGLIAYFAGPPIAWASALCYVLTSGSRVGLVYGEGLNAGRAMLAMLCWMLDEQAKNFEKVLHG